MLCAPSTGTGEYSKAKRAEDTPQIAMLNYVGLMEALEAMEWDDASYDNTSVHSCDTAAVGCRRAGSWPTKLPCGHEFVSIK